MALDGKGGKKEIIRAPKAAYKSPAKPKAAAYKSPQITGGRSPANPVTVTVKPGDTNAAIAMRLGVSPEIAKSFIPVMPRVGTQVTVPVEAAPVPEAPYTSTGSRGRVEEMAPPAAPTGVGGRRGIGIQTQARAGTPATLGPAQPASVPQAASVFEQQDAYRRAVIRQRFGGVAGGAPVIASPYGGAYPSTFELQDAQRRAQIRSQFGGQPYSLQSPFSQEQAQSIANVSSVGNTFRNMTQQQFSDWLVNRQAHEGAGAFTFSGGLWEAYDNLYGTPGALYPSQGGGGGGYGGGGWGGGSSGYANSIAGLMNWRIGL